MIPPLINSLHHRVTQKELKPKQHTQQSDECVFSVHNNGWLQINGYNNGK